VKAAIRAKLYQDFYPVESRIAKRKPTQYDRRHLEERRARRTASDNGLPADVLRDRQSEEQKAKRELAAKAKDILFQMRLNAAIPGGGRCIGDPACPYPSLLDGCCRKHAMDRYAQASLMTSTLGLADPVGTVGRNNGRSGPYPAAL
jgi:hypothetical protein